MVTKAYACRFGLFNKENDLRIFGVLYISLKINIYNKKVSLNDIKKY